jgi:putative sigma-54 modulation protein
MREHARQKAEKLSRVSNMIMRVTVTLSIESDRQLAEVAATMRHRGEVVAKAESHDMYASIDQAMSRLEKQLHKVGDRIKDKRETGRDKWEQAAAGETAPDADEEAEENE